MSEMVWEPTSLRYAGIPVIDLHKRRTKENTEVTRKRYREVIALGGVLGVGLVVCLPLTVMAFQQRGLLKTVQQQTAQVEKRVATVAQSSVEVDTGSAQWQKFTISRGRREGWAAFSLALASCVPNGLFLEQVQVDGTTDKKEKITVRGYCERGEIMQQMMTSLKKMPFFTSVSLIEANAYPELGSHGIQFKFEVTGNGALTSPTGK